MNTIADRIYSFYTTSSILPSPEEWTDNPHLMSFEEVRETMFEFLKSGDTYQVGFQIWETDRTIIGYDGLHLTLLLTSFSPQQQQLVEAVMSFHKNSIGYV